MLRAPASAVDALVAGKLAGRLVELRMFGEQWRGGMLPRLMAETVKLRDQADAQGSRQAGERLRPVTDATSVRVRNGKSEVLNGPYADTQEQLGGYYVIDVPDLDAALVWAARCPSSVYGTIEVRPIWEM